MNRTLLLMVVCFVASSCTARSALRPQSLADLNGYDVAVARPVVVEGVRGDVTLHPDDELELRWGDGRMVRHSFTHLDVKPGVLTGTLRDGEQLQLDTANLKRVTVVSSSPARTAGLVLLIAGSVAAAVAVGVAVGTASTPTFGINAGSGLLHGLFNSSL